MADGTDADIALQAVEAAIVGAAPERTAELRQLWDEYSPHFAVVDDRAGFTLEAGAFGIVNFTAKTIRQIWMLADACWKAFEAHGAVLQVVGLAGRPFDPAEFSADPMQIEADAAFDAILREAENLNRAERLDDFDWPPTVPMPEGVPFADSRQQATYDLAIIALAFVFLHEVQHVRFAQDNDAPASHVEEEIECDRRARDFLLRDVSNYADQSGYPEHKVRDKRAMGIALGAFVILAVTPYEGWGGSTSHPPMGRRIDALLAPVDLPADAHMWTFASAFLIGMMQRAKTKIAPVSFVDAQDLFVKLARLLPTEVGRSPLKEA